MPITYQEAAKQVEEAIKAQGKFNIGNALDVVIGVAITNQDVLQTLLNDLLTKKGILTPHDEALLNDLMAQQEAEKKHRQQIRTKNTVIIIAVVTLIGGAIYFAFKKDKK